METLVTQLYKRSDKNPIEEFVCGSFISSLAENSINLFNADIAVTTPHSYSDWYVLESRISDFQQLQNNWDGNNAEAISNVALTIAYRILQQLKIGNISSQGLTINVFPMRDGGIQFEFDSVNICAELEINPEGLMQFLLFNEYGAIISKQPIFVYELSEITNLLEEVIYA